MRVESSRNWSEDLGELGELGKNWGRVGEGGIKREGGALRRKKAAIIFHYPIFFIFVTYIFACLVLK